MAIKKRGFGPGAHLRPALGESACSAIHPHMCSKINKRKQKQNESGSCFVENQPVITDICQPKH